MTMLPLPSPPTGYHYVRQELPGGQYQSTGWYKNGAIGKNGTGRTVKARAGVGSLMFDIDMVTLISAARAAKGGAVADSLAKQKEYMYHLPDDVVSRYKGWAREELLPTMDAAMGCAPTTVVDTGWGFHLHYRVSPEVCTNTTMLQAVAKLAISEANRLCYELGRQMTPQVELGAMWDATHDVGARLCRVPATLNTKAKHRPVRCEVVAGGDPKTVVGKTTCADVQRRLGAPLFEVPKRKSTLKARSNEVDFRERVMPDGRNWQTIVEGLAPGETLKVVCPYGGNTVGSGWFTREADGRVRYNSHPQKTTTWNSAPPPRRTSGRAELIKSHKGGVRNTLTNLKLLLTGDGRFQLWYDSFRESVMNFRESVTDELVMTIRLIMEADYGWWWNVADARIWGLVELVARENTRNPVADYLAGLRWDGQSRVDRLLIDGLGALPVALHRAYSRRFLVGMVARALEPGCKLDTSLVLTGPQGFGKSRFFKELVDLPGFDGGLFSDTRFNINDKDSYSMLYQCWLYEDAEMTGQSSGSAASRKAFLSSSVDRYRPPYGRKVRTYRRHNVIVGTTNDSMFLTAKTGSRRQWVGSVGRTRRKADRLDIEWVRRNRGQLFAEAVVLYRAGEQWWLTGPEERARGLQNSMYQYSDWYTECAEEVYAANSGGVDAGFQVKEFCQAIPHMGTNPPNPQRDGRRLKLALMSAGFEYMHTNRHQRTYYRRTVQSDEVDNGLWVLSSKDSAPFAARLVNAKS